MKSKKVLEWCSLFDAYPTPIIPAKSVVPQWYKKITKWRGVAGESHQGIYPTAAASIQTVKQCAPFGDALLTGYVITLPYDIVVEYKDGQPFLRWLGHEELKPPITTRDEYGHGIPVPSGYDSTSYVWLLPIIFKLPVGYSAIFTHPLNRYDLPFSTVNAVIDGGFALPPSANVPFFLKEYFEGVIPQGTPIAQVIPFKQENWVIKNSPGLLNEGLLNLKKHSLIFGSLYKLLYWKKKSYE